MSYDFISKDSTYILNFLKQKAVFQLKSLDPAGLFPYLNVSTDTALVRGRLLAVANLLYIMKIIDRVSAASRVSSPPFPGGFFYAPLYL